MNRLLLISFILMSYLCSNAQGIQNTKWQTFNAGLTDTVTVVIGVDTIEQYVHPDTILVKSWYTEVNDTVTLYDVSGLLACPSEDTGMYLYTVANDTLTITLLTDQCLQRSMVYDGVELWRIDKPIGIAESVERKIEFGMWPNPSSGQISIQSPAKAELSIFGADGRKYIEAQLIRENTINDYTLPSGTYFVRLTTDRTSDFKKLIVR